ncbi:hypothetical protein [Aerosakkonema funiforme]|uniref:Uncharacterized protein n=1 Tax=Aerosakkonema funiforme FACHB-1375 TaxID=2949571 RepID=A0A926VE81_9CYAN|nr:hypothetical protein [Aerosakkonema funiforme]MBD2182281.1 hypothetical protein [Aerosakkonema funiforme FACHB-1375]
MKISLLALSLLSFSTALAFESFSNNPAGAQCVQFDQGIQISVSGSGPAQRSNNVEMQSEGRCVGNTIVTTGEQIHVGPGRAVQERNVRQTIRGTNKNGIAGGRTIQIRVNPTIDVNNPADRYRNLQRR